MKQIYLLLVYFILISCGMKLGFNQKSNLNNDLKDNDIHCQNIDDSIKVIPLNLSNDVILTSAIFDLESMVYLDSTALIGEIDKIIYFEERFYILDQSKAEKVYCFGTNGKFLFTISNKGRGPGEYSALYDMTIDEWNREILLYDGKKVIFCDLNGNFIRQRKIDLFGKNLSVIDSSGTLLFNQGNTIYNKDLMFNLIAVDTVNRIRAKLRPFNESDAGINLRPWFYLSQNNKKTYYIEAFNDTIYQINSKTFAPKFIMDYGTFSTPIKLREKIALGEQKQNPEEMNHMTTVIQNDSTVFVLNSTQDKFIFTFYDIRSELSRSFRTSVNDLIAPSVVMYPKGSFGDNYFVVPIDPYSIHILYRSIIKNSTKVQLEKFLQSPQSKNMIQILNNTNENSNPVLVLVKVKKNYYENK